ncbi:hypothetical protein FRB99_005108 [Tulasnella sp. 403]|nr:hypothetical protein FRB99_005108 [Tulasnella sp. 403]
MAHKTVGGTRWWQVRGLEGIPGEWIAVRKDIDAQRERRKASLERAKSQKNPNEDHNRESNAPEPHEYSKEMEGTPCMLYIHGGGGYFGSIDQERYTLHRYARKMNGRVFAINYRLAPQYPFPCAIQDVLAAYQDLYLIRPPPGAYHAPVDPSLIIPAGDSAGGNLVLALLQVIRDAKLPQPAGAVLISPWCDLTHSFPSCMTNATTDIIPPYGLSLHKPSPLWPPPSSIETTVTRDRFTSRLKKTISRGLSNQDNDDTETLTTTDPTQRKLGFGRSITLLGDHISQHPSTISEMKQAFVTIQDGPSPPDIQKTVVPGDAATLLVDGKTVTIHSQIQFYAMNSQLVHPLVSPALGYLGGLPPCLFIASDKELLRDEIIYTAHKAAHPAEYPIKEESRDLYPALENINDRFGPTDVHLQVYDETCHVLPLYSFTTPAKFCYRAIATFCKFVIVQANAQVVAEPASAVSPTVATWAEISIGSQSSNRDLHRRATTSPRAGRLSVFKSTRTSLLRRMSLPSNGRRLSGGEQDSDPNKADVVLPVTSESEPQIVDQEPPSATESQSGSHFWSTHVDDPHRHWQVGTAGHPAVYACDDGRTPFQDHMIRERIATNGIIRPLEPASTIPACNMPLEDIGVLNENSVRRYIEGQRIWERKFAKVARSIEERRMKNLKLAKKEGTKMLHKLRTQLHIAGKEAPLSPIASLPASAERLTTTVSTPPQTADENETIDLSQVYAKTVLGSRQWTWGWAVEGENPPPSSIVARGDTEEARRLSKFADRQLGPGDEEHSMSGNNLWSVVVESLTSHGKGNGDSNDPSRQNSERSESSGGVTTTVVSAPSTSTRESQRGGNTTRNRMSWFPSFSRQRSPSRQTSGSSSPTSGTRTNSVESQTTDAR